MSLYRRSQFLLLVIPLLLPGNLPLSWAAETVQFSVSAGSHDRRNTPVCITLDSANELAGKSVDVVRVHDGARVPAQIAPMGLLATPRAGIHAQQLHFVLPELPANSSDRYRVEFSSTPAPAETGFHWRDSENEFADLLYGERPLVRYMHQALDDSSPERREATFKVFHHVYDPAGKQLLTKGVGGLYPHHRGLFYGFSKVEYGEAKQCDIWHCRGAHQQHAEFVSREVGPVLGRHRVAIEWRGNDKELFAREERELTAYAVPGGVLLDFASRLTPVLPPVKLDGDPQHAGFHFRAAQEVAEKTKDQTYFLRPDGRGAPGETRNWPDHPTHVDLPFDGMSFVVDGQRYTVLYLDHPGNPKPARFSERDYGRFGSYFTAELAAGKQLDARYRVWLQAGEMTVEQAASLDADFDDSPAVAVD